MIRLFCIDVPDWTSSSNDADIWILASLDEMTSVGVGDETSLPVNVDKSS